MGNHHHKYHHGSGLQNRKIRQRSRLKYSFKSGTDPEMTLFTVQNTGEICKVNCCDGLKYPDQIAELPTCFPCLSSTLHFTIAKQTQLNFVTVNIKVSFIHESQKVRVIYVISMLQT